MVMSLDEQVVRRFLAGPVVPFRPRPGVPTFPVGGRKYMLSTDGGPLGDREDDHERADDPRVIGPDPGANKWRYLWAYDTEKQVVAMWRVSDGSEKLWGPARSEMATILKLDRKGQINRVTTNEFTRIDAFMRDAERDTLDALKKIVEDSKGDREKAIDKVLKGLWAKLRPQLEAQLNDVRQGATPIGFHPHRPDNLERQAMVFVITQFFRRHLDTEKILPLLGKKIPTLDPDLAGHYQDVQWAIDDVRDAAFEEYLPPR